MRSFLGDSCLIFQKILPVFFLPSFITTLGIPQQGRAPEQESPGSRQKLRSRRCKNGKSCYELSRSKSSISRIQQSNFFLTGKLRPEEWRPLHRRVPPQANGLKAVPERPFLKEF